jgi:hypothetical protein
VIRLTLRSREAFPANSSTSAVRYSRTAAKYTLAPFACVQYEKKKTKIKKENKEN